MLYFCVGLARCGKSTYCQKWASESPKRAIVSGDDIRLALHGNRYSSYAEGTVFSILQVMTRSLLIGGFDVIVDETNTSYTSCRRILEIDSSAVAIVFDTPLLVCQQRAIDTEQSDLIPVISNHYNNLLKIDQKYGSYSNMMIQIVSDINKRWGKDSIPNKVIR